jgi:DNA-binding CsgD family transcriptional regulator
MTEHIDPIRLLGNPPARRLWLLQEAMRSLQLDRAIELARIAEAFVAGSAVDAAKSEIAPPIDNEERGQLVDQGSTSAAVPADSAIERNGLALSDNDRERLLDRLAKGARNVELAGEFGISAKQVQGLRMGCAREIARRRAAPSDKPSDEYAVHHEDSTASIEEIVRYLRQQDDVVVPQEDGGYLVNGRFRMSAAELIVRANRMRSRQHKASLQTFGTSIQRVRGSGPTGHPLFWENPARTERGPNGRVQPANTNTDDP